MVDIHRCYFYVTTPFVCQLRMNRGFWQGFIRRRAGRASAAVHTLRHGNDVNVKCRIPRERKRTRKSNNSNNIPSAAAEKELSIEMQIHRQLGGWEVRELFALM